MQIDENDWREVRKYIAALEHAGYTCHGTLSSDIGEPTYLFSVKVGGMEHSMSLGFKQLKKEAFLYVEKS